MRNRRLDRLVQISGRVLLLGFPAVMMALVTLRVPAEVVPVFWAGAELLAGAALLLGWLNGRIDEPSGPTLILLYITGLCWLLLAIPRQHDWIVHLAQAVFLIVPLVFFARQCLRDSGATTMRRARQLANGLATRRDWPDDLLDCRNLPEVKALRESMVIDASPALELLVHASPAVRVAALAALEYRSHWRTGQPQVVLQVARRAAEPEVRAAAALALANSDERVIIESLAELLRDPSPRVRETATERCCGTASALAVDSRRRAPRPGRRELSGRRALKVTAVSLCDERWKICMCGRGRRGAFRSASP
ncbi:MAG: HEAT repeat domain-containing protein [Gemmataceae bacterium]